MLVLLKNVIELILSIRHTPSSPEPVLSLFQIEPLLPSRWSLRMHIERQRPIYGHTLAFLRPPIPRMDWSLRLVDGTRRFLSDNQVD